MMGVLAAEIAEALSEEWDSKTESCEAFILRRYPNAPIGEFVDAVNIMGELIGKPPVPPLFTKRPKR